MIHRAVVLIVALLSCTGAFAATFETRSARFTYPDSYRQSMEGNTLLFTGPSGERLRVSAIAEGPEDVEVVDYH